MAERKVITRVDPEAAIPGGEIVLECDNYDTSNLRSCRALFDGEQGWLVGATPRRVLALVPESAPGGEMQVSLESGDDELSASARVQVGRKLAEDLHSVASPAFDPDDGSLYVTRSGARGQKESVSLFRLDTLGMIHDVTGDIVNPTGIAFDPQGQLFVTSRHEELVYRLTPFADPVPFARNLGTATGIAFDSVGNMYVGDRTGTIYEVNGIGQARAWAHLEPSVAAYHLASHRDDYLYVTGPTVSSFDAVMRLDRRGNPEVFFRGLGRPGGLAFDTEGFLYIAASYRARRGIVRISPDGSEAKLVVAGMNVIGVAFSAQGEMVVATSDAVYSLALGIEGTLIK